LRKAVDRRTDVWALGAVLYRMLSRHTPYESPSPVTSLRLLSSHAPPAPLPDDVEPKLATLVLRALHPHREGRPETALELQNELEGLAPSLGGLASSQELASFVTAHLGQALQERREKISRALRSASDRDTAVELPAPATDSASGVKDTIVDDKGPALPPEADTGALHPTMSSALTLQMASRAPEAPPRKRWLAALGALALLSALLAALRSSESEPSPSGVNTKNAAATPSSLPAPEPERPEPQPAVTSLASLPEEAPLTLEMLPPPVLPSALPLSEPPVARAVVKPAVKPASVARTKAPKQKAASKPAPARKTVDDGF
jgi:serine/threonine-protein kinase